MALQSSIGLAVGVSASLPPTHDSSGFSGLTFVACGKVSTAPTMTGINDTATFDDLTTGEEFKFSDMLRAGSGTMMFGYDPADTGQAALETAADADSESSNVALEFTLKNGDVYYRLAVITGYTPQPAIGSVLMASVALEFYRKHIKVEA
jgi:hypothetical protein